MVSCKGTGLPLEGEASPEGTNETPSGAPGKPERPLQPWDAQHPLTHDKQGKKCKPGANSPDTAWWRMKPSS